MYIKKKCKSGGKRNRDGRTNKSKIISGFDKVCRWISRRPRRIYIFLHLKINEKVKNTKIVNIYIFVFSFCAKSSYNINFSKNEHLL